MRPAQAAALIVAAAVAFTACTASPAVRDSASVSSSTSASEPVPVTVSTETTTSASPSSTTTTPTPPVAETPTSTTGGQPAVVIRVVDGDTIHVVDAQGVAETVRLLGVNTPEITKGKNECYGQEAAAYTHGFLFGGARATLTADPTQADRDRYGRLIRYVNNPVTGEDLEYQLIRYGYAKEATYARKYERQSVYRQAQREAQAEQRGGWGVCGWTA